MTCQNNVLKGREYVLLVRNDADTEWEIVGGVRSRSSSFNNPTEEVTSSSTTTDFTEREFTGFSDVSISISGTADTRTGITDPVTGLNIVGYSRLAKLATTGNRCGKFRMESTNPNLVYDIEGEFTIATLTSSGDTPGLLTFDATLESRASVTVTTA